MSKYLSQILHYKADDVSANAIFGFIVRRENLAIDGTSNDILTS